MEFVEVVNKFDLGYIIKFSDGRIGQLRYPDMKDKLRKFHLEGNESRLFGEMVEVNIIFEQSNTILVSQLSVEERNQRESENEAKKIARESCKIGDQLIVEIEKIMEWGLICINKTVKLEGLVPKAKYPIDINFVVGNKLLVKVIDFAESGNPIFTVIIENNAA